MNVRVPLHKPRKQQQCLSALISYCEQWWV